MIGIITINNDTFTNPTLFTLIKKLNDNGHSIALFNRKNQYAIPSDLKYINYFDAPRGFQFPKRPVNFFNYLLLYWRIIKQIKANKISNMIAVDPIGLILAGRIKRIYPINIHYFSFEIFFAEEVKNNPIYNSLKKKEAYYTQFVKSILVQDEERKKCLIRENKIKTLFHNWYLIPVAPTIKDNGIKYNRAKYGIQETDVVYIHSGSIAEWAGIDQIIQAIEAGLPANTLFFIHNRAKFDLSNKVHQKLFELQASNPNVILHDELFNDYEDYLSFLRIFDYGLVLYEPDGGIFTGNNIKEIGLSSGKFSTYMAVGLPSLLFNCTAYHKILKEYPIGSIVTKDENLSFHVKNKSLAQLKKEDCISLYKKMLDPELNLNLLITTELI